MAEFTRDHKNGTIVKCDGGFYVVKDWDEDDGQYMCLDITDPTQEVFGEQGWQEAEDLKAAEGDLPEWCNQASHAFVYEWMDDHVANVSLHAEPQDLVDAYFPDADEDERRTLTTKLMEAVVDPGERVELVPGGGAVRFCVVNA
jgi:hypothetical protein